RTPAPAGVDTFVGRRDRPRCERNRTRLRPSNFPLLRAVAILDLGLLRVALFGRLDSGRDLRGGLRLLLRRLHLGPLRGRERGARLWVRAGAECEEGGGRDG